MGSRTNWTIITTDYPDQNINVYSHWDGENGENLLYHAVKKALPRLKMGDTSYAAKIIVDQLTRDGRDEETGYGINIGKYPLFDEEYQYKEVNLIKNTVTIGYNTYDLDKWVLAVV